MKGFIYLPLYMYAREGAEEGGVVQYVLSSVFFVFVKCYFSHCCVRSEMF